MKIDLHCHSKHSSRPTLWFMQKLGCPESFTEPLELYQICRRKGMNAVTITDHNVIDGALEIAHLPHAFIGCEYTTYFPRDRAKVHVLVYGQSEAQHEELSKIRRDSIFEFVDYLQRERLEHICAHPLFGPGETLTVDHVELLALLFKNWELNGDRNPEQNAAIQVLLEHWGPDEFARMIDKHGYEPRFAEPWKKNLTSGSDDHSSLNLTVAHTEVAGAETLNDFWRGVNEGHARVRMRDATPQLFARNVYGIAFQFYKSKFDIDRYVNKDVFLRFLDRNLQTRLEELPDPWHAKLTMRLRKHRGWRQPEANASLFSLARREAEKYIWDDPQLMAIVKDGASQGGELDAKWFDFVNAVSNKLLVHLGKRVLDRVMHAHLLDLFNSFGAGAGLYTLIAPYQAAFSLFSFEREFSGEVLRHFLGDRAEGLTATRPNRVAHFTDTFKDVNGVARTLQQQLANAQALGKDYTILTAFGEAQPFERGVQQFTPVGTVTLPEYPELKLLCPPFLEMLNHCFEERYTHIHAATPGPVGLAALAIARILKLPVVGTYHTALPQYAKALTDDASVEDVMWKFMIWFYDQLDAIYVPSKATAKDLLDRGINPNKIKVYPRGIDVDRFHPEKAMPILEERFDIHDRAPRLLYVGRVSREKNLPVLCQAYLDLLSRGIEARLIVAGDGPYREEMEQTLAGAPAVFTGYLGGDDLPALYASSDLFVFPSTTDTFGNVVLEAQACGIPVLVTDEGGPHENMVPGETGAIVAGNDATALADGMAELLRDRSRLTAMGAASREYMANRGFREAFEQLWDMYIADRPTKREDRAKSPLGESLFDAIPDVTAKVS